LIQEVPSGPNSEQSFAPLVDDPRPHPPFKLAVVSGSEQLVRMHIARGRNVNVRDESGTSLLGLAASKGLLEVSRILLEAGANPAVRDHKGPRSIRTGSHEWFQRNRVRFGGTARPRQFVSCS
jgi:hypothetical protein